MFAADLHLFEARYPLGDGGRCDLKRTGDLCLGACPVLIVCILMDEEAQDLDLRLGEFTVFPIYFEAGMAEPVEDVEIAGRLLGEVVLTLVCMQVPLPLEDDGSDGFIDDPCNGGRRNTVALAELGVGEISPLVLLGVGDERAEDEPCNGGEFLAIEARRKDAHGPPGV